VAPGASVVMVPEIVGVGLSWVIMTSAGFELIDGVSWNANVPAGW
jgi:hypothetical protein